MDPNAALIARLVINPKVQRWVREVGFFTPASGTFSVSYSVLASRDAVDYGLSAGTPRYSSMRVLRGRAWLESPQPLITQPAFGLILTDLVSDVSFQARSVGSNRYASVGCWFCLETRQAQVSTTSSSLVASISTDTVVPATGLLAFTFDLFCEFA